MKSPIQIMMSVASIGGRLGIAGENLRMLLPPDCPGELKSAIREQKAQLITLLRLNFLLIKSDAVNDTLLWASDETTRSSLIAAGADPGVVYSPAELQSLADGRLSCAELSELHSAKKVFGGKINP